MLTDQGKMAPRSARFRQPLFPSGDSARGALGDSGVTAPDDLGCLSGQAFPGGLPPRLYRLPSGPATSASTAIPPVVAIGILGGAVRARGGKRALWRQVR